MAHLGKADFQQAFARQFKKPLSSSVCFAEPTCSYVKDDVCFGDALADKPSTGIAFRAVVVGLDPPPG